MVHTIDEQFTRNIYIPNKDNLIEKYLTFSTSHYRFMEILFFFQTRPFLESFKLLFCTHINMVIIKFKAHFGDRDQYDLPCLYIWT